MTSALWKKPSVYLALVLASAVGIWSVQGSRADEGVVGPFDSSLSPEQQQFNRIAIAREAHAGAVQILDRALANPAIYDSPAAQTIYRVRTAIYDQYFNIIPPNSAEFYQVCVGASAVDGRIQAHAGTVNSGSCVTELMGGTIGASRCTVNICPAAFSGSYLGQVIIHEMVHAIGIYNECTAEGTTLWALRLGGGDMRHNGYTSPCGLDFLFSN